MREFLSSPGLRLREREGSLELEGFPELEGFLETGGFLVFMRLVGS